MALLTIFTHITGCSKTGYDYKALGFDSKEAMESSFKKGYHTKQKLDQMITAAAPAKAPTASPSEPVATASPSAATAVAESTQLQTQQPVTCATPRACAEIMIASARTENLARAMAAAKQIDEMPKPLRGDRKTARKLNDEGLEALKQKKYEEAAAIFIKASAADSLDEEIIANLVFTYGEATNFGKSEELAYKGLLLNPRRANLWLPIAVAKQKQGKSKEALQAMWLAWQFTENKQRLLDLIEKRSAGETDESLKSMFVAAKVWFVDNKRPNL